MVKPERRVATVGTATAQRNHMSFNRDMNNPYNGGKYATTTAPVSFLLTCLWRAS